MPTLTLCTILVSVCLPRRTEPLVYPVVLDCLEIRFNGEAEFNAYE